MAGNFQIWERNIAPAGEFVVPQGTTMGEAIGAGLQNLGEAGERVALAERSAQERIQQKNDDAWLGKQKPQAIIDLDKTVGDLEDGAEAGAPGHVDQVVKAVDDYTGALLKQAPDDRSKAEIESYMGTLKAGYLGQAGQFQKASELAQRGQHIDEATDLWGSILTRDPSKYQAAVDQVKKTIGAQGLNGDQGAAYERNAIQALGAYAMSGMAASQPQVLMQQIDAGAWDGKADPEKIAQFKALAASDIKRAQDETAQQAQQAQLDRQAKIAALRQEGSNILGVIQTGQTYAGMDDYVKRANAAGAPALAETVMRAQNDVTWTRNLWKMGPTAIQTELDRTKEQIAKAGRNGDSEWAGILAQRVAIGEKVRDQVVTALRNDPLSLAEQAGAVETTDVLGNLADPAATTSAIAQRQQAIAATAARYGVTPQFLKPAEVEGVLTALKGNDGGAVAATLQRTMGDAYPQLLQQMQSKASPITMTALMLDLPDQAATRNKLLEIERNGGAAVLEKGLPPGTSAKGIRDKVVGALTMLERSFANQPGGAQVFAGIEDAASALALSYVGRGETTSAAAQHAAGEVATNYYATGTFNEQTYRVPAGHDPDQVADGLALCMQPQNLPASRIDRPADVPDMKPDDLAAALMAHGWWSTTGDEQGLMLRLPSGTPATIEGKPIVMSFKELEQLSKDQPPAAPHVLVR